MSGHVSFRLEGRGLDHVAIVLCRDELPANGDTETAFFDGISQLQRHSAPGLSPAMAAAAQMPDIAVVVVIRNPALVMDQNLAARIAAALRAVPDGMDWALAGAGGLAPDGGRHLALYASAAPAIPEVGGLQPLIDVMPDLYLVDASFLRMILAEQTTLPDAAAEPYLVTRGQLLGRISLFVPQLRAGIDGHLLGRDFDRLATELRSHLWAHLPGETVRTLSGDVTLETPACASATRTNAALPDKIDALVCALARMPSLSIVTRTRFARPGLLRRLLTSISRARRDDMDLEVVLASDADQATCDRLIEDLRGDFLNLDLRLCRTTDREAPSRIANLISGLAAARNEYVAIVDDDDYLDVFAFDNLRPAFFCGNRPLIVTGSQTHEERWEHTPSGRDVLVHSQPAQGYPADGWRRMFSGINRLPISSVIAPREWLISRVARFPFRHDLSEDYALFLLLLTAPDLPAICERAEVFCHISQRGTENSVTMPDRRPWVRDITAYLADLTDDPTIAPPGLWALLTSPSAAAEASGAATIADLTSALARRDAEIRLLRHERDVLRAQSSQEETTA